MVSLLRRLGLNQYESRLYLALLGSGSSTASDLSGVANIPRPRTYDVLDKLEKYGFVTVQPGRPTKFNAVGIEEAFDNLKKRKASEFEKELEEINKIGISLRGKIKITEPLEAADTTDFVWVLKSRDVIYSKLNSLIQNAKDTIIISTTNKGLKRKLKNHEKSLKKAKERGVDIRFIVPKETEYSKKARKLGDVVFRDHGHRFAIADDQVLLFLTSEEDEKKEVGAWIKSPYFAKGIRKLV